MGLREIAQFQVVFFDQVVTIVDDGFDRLDLEILDQLTMTSLSGGKSCLIKTPR